MLSLFNAMADEVVTFKIALPANNPLAKCNDYLDPRCKELIKRAHFELWGYGDNAELATEKTMEVLNEVSAQFGNYAEADDKIRFHIDNMMATSEDDTLDLIVVYPAEAADAAAEDGGNGDNNINIPVVPVMAAVPLPELPQAVEV